MHPQMPVSTALYFWHSKLYFSIRLSSFCLNSSIVIFPLLNNEKNTDISRLIFHKLKFSALNKKSSLGTISHGCISIDMPRLVNISFWGGTSKYAVSSFIKREYDIPIKSVVQFCRKYGFCISS